MFKRTAFMAAVIGLSLGGCAMTQPQVPASVADTAKGKTLVDATGMVLYSFDKDSAGKSACNGPCAQNWPPFAAMSASASGDWTAVTRDDGSKQWAYRGKPLYTFVKDTKPGDTVGDGFLNNQWHVARP